jgi:hypothetical protein
MKAVLEAQRLMLLATHKACARQPDVHAHQLLVLEREIERCAMAATLQDYQRATGGGFEWARAAWLDRVAGRFRVALAVADHDAARAALAEYRGALAAPGWPDWTAALQAAARAAAPWSGRSAQTGSSLTRSVLNLLLHHSCTPPLADHWGDAVGAWRALCAVDPAAASALRGTGAWPARVASRLPWRDGPARAWLRRLLADLPAPPPNEPGAAQGVEPDDLQVHADLVAQQAGQFDTWRRSLRDAPTGVALPAPAADAAWCPAAFSAEQALAPWRTLADPASAAVPDALAGVARRLLAVAAGAANGPEVQRCAIESGLLTELAAAPLLDRLAAIETRQARWPQPLLAAHARALRAALAQAGTSTEVEWVSTHAEACLAIEADWQLLFLAAQSAPLVAALNAAISPADAERGLRGASAISRHLLGQAPAATLRSPPVQAHLQALAQIDRPGQAPDMEDALVWRGEAGNGLLPLLRAWTVVAAARGQPVPEDVAGRLTALHRAAAVVLDGSPPATPVTVQLWGVRADAALAAQLLAAPGRPAGPLGSGPGAAGLAV